MVEEDAQLAIVILLIAEGVLNLVNCVSCRAREIVRAHRNGGATLLDDLVIIEDDARPAFAAVDGKAFVLGVAACDRSGLQSRTSHLQALVGTDFRRPWLA